MSPQDKKAFAEVVGMLFEVFNQPEPSSRTLRAWWMVLEDYPLSAVEQGAAEYLRTGKYPPKPSDVREAITGAMRDHWPTADEAWASAQAAIDERNTVVWTEQGKQAWFQSAQPLMEAGDKIAARRAFIDTYERLVREAMAAGKPPSVEVSEGHDPDSRRPAIEQAVDRGLLTNDQAEQKLIGTDREVTGDGQAVAGLLGHGDPTKASDEAIDWLAKIKSELANLPNPTEERRLEREAERKALAERQAQALEELRRNRGEDGEGAA